MSKQKAYLIDWVDSASDQGWKHYSELTQTTSHCQTLGFFVKEDKTSMTFALSRATSRDFAPYADLMTIPKSCIKKKRKIKI